MKFISIIIPIFILYLIQVSVCDSEEPEAEINDSTIASEVLEKESEYQNGMKEKMQVDPSEEDDEELDANGENGNGDIQNQDDDTDSNAESTAQPNLPNAGQPNPDQTRVYSMPGSSGSDIMPQPEYSPSYNPTARGKM